MIATKLYSETFPEWFGDLGASGYTLFQVMTLESWSMGIVRPVMEEHPFAWMFFVPFIIISSFAVLNLFIGVIVNALQELHDSEKQEVEETATAIAHAEGDRVLAVMEEMRAEILQLREDIRRMDDIQK